jgi:hypothetical protein
VDRSADKPDDLVGLDDAVVDNVAAGDRVDRPGYEHAVIRPGVRDLDPHAERSVCVYANLTGQRRADRDRGGGGRRERLHRHACKPWLILARLLEGLHDNRPPEQR